MLRRSMLLLIAGAMSGGCSRDGPVMGPVLEATDVAVVANAQAADAEINADAIDDALQRLVPALGERGNLLRIPLLRLQSRRTDRAALGDLRRAYDAVGPTLPAAYRPDFDALGLELGLLSK